MGRMARLRPDFISCTWGAGGSTQERTLEVCTTAQSMYGLETVMHLTCTNMEKATIDLALQVRIACPTTSKHNLLKGSSFFVGANV